MPAVHLQNEVGVPPDNNGPYGYRCPLGWSLAGPLTNRDKGKAVVIFLSVDLQTEDHIKCYWKIEDYGATKLRRVISLVNRGQASIKNP